MEIHRIMCHGLKTISTGMSCFSTAHNISNTLKETSYSSKCCLENHLDSLTAHARPIPLVLDANARGSGPVDQWSRIRHYSQFRDRTRESHFSGTSTVQSNSGFDEQEHKLVANIK